MSRPKLSVWARAQTLLLAVIALLASDAGAVMAAAAATGGAAAERAASSDSASVSGAAVDSAPAVAPPGRSPAHWFGDSRGMVIGVGGGYGSGRVLYPDLVDGARFSRDWRRGNSLDLTLDLPLATRATAGISLAAWFGAIWTSRNTVYGPVAKDDNWSLTAASARFGWYPLGGLFLRGGVGWASVGVTFADFNAFEQIMRDSGLGWSAGAGYEIGVARGLALVPSVEWRGFELGAGNRAEALVVGLSAALAP